MASIISDTISSIDQKCNCNHSNQVKHGMFVISMLNTYFKKAGMTFNTPVFMASIISNTISSIDKKYNCNHLKSGETRYVPSFQC